jgi:hypothetical protein
MGLYQIRLRGREGMDGYDTFLARNVEDAIKQATEEAKHTLEEIEEVKLLLSEDEVNQVIHELKIQIDDSFNQLRVFVDSGQYCDMKNIDWVGMSINADAIRGKTEQLYRFMSALHKITDDMPHHFGYTVL